MFWGNQPQMRIMSILFRNSSLCKSDFISVFFTRLEPKCCTVLRSVLFQYNPCMGGREAALHGPAWRPHFQRPRPDLEPRDRPPAHVRFLGQHAQVLGRPQREMHRNGHRPRCRHLWWTSLRCLFLFVWSEVKLWSGNVFFVLFPRQLIFTEAKRHFIFEKVFFYHLYFLFLLFSTVAFLAFFIHCQAFHCLLRLLFLSHETRFLFCGCRAMHL